MKANEAEATRLLLIHEGGNDDDPRDPGGRTSRGILQSEWDVYRRGHTGRPVDVWEAPQADVFAIYHQKYWVVLRCDDLPPGVDYAVYDYGVNSGVYRAAKVLQAIVGAEVDGEIGPQTLGETRAMDAATIIKAICDERMAFLKGLKTWPTFKNGWTRRVSEVRATALKMVTQAPKSAGKGFWDFVAALLKSLFSPKPAESKPGPSSSPTWMQWANREIGFHETGNNHGIEKYITLAKTGSIGDPWCAIFINAALEACAIRGTRSAMARSFERDPNFVKLSGPALGAIVTMWRGSPSLGTGHVFLYGGENGNGVLALGGNQSDMVCRQYEPRERIVGYYWPKSVPLPTVGKIIVIDKEGHRKGGSEV